jgi:hypothetical protein
MITLESLYFVSTLVVLLSLILLELIRTMFIYELKKRDREVWELLGKPTGYFLSFFLRIDGFKLERFILKRKYLDLNALIVKNIGGMYYLVQIVFLLSVVVFLLLLVYQLIVFD